MITDPPHTSYTVRRTVVVYGRSAVVEEEKLQVDNVIIVIAYNIPWMYRIRIYIR